jgi:glycerophosphoryl diester phosphodiesterase
MKVIGHRGARGLAPENTIASLKKALEHHVDEIEFDLRVTKDGIVVLHHNRDVIDPNDTHRRIAQHTYKELLVHKKDLATLNEALDTVNRAVPLYIEVKPGEPTDPIVSILRDYLKKTGQPEDFSFGSYSFKVLKALHASMPDIQTIVIDNWSGVRAAHRARKLGTKQLSMSRHWLWPGFIRAMSRRGYQLISFTVNDPKQSKRWERAGLYGIVTDYPDRYEKK